jgi:phosphatidylserine/phosphatidylglycerophosphate/cardiolipin synthase-like enzyme
MSRKTSDALFVPGRNCWRVARAERAAVLIDGEAYFGSVADAIERAEHSIIIIGWDFDSRTRLRWRGNDRDPEHIGALMDEALQRRPALHVYILDWDYSFIYIWQRELLSGWRLGRRSHGRVHFRLDGTHPLGAAQHQKVVIVDDALAFVGGFDFGPCRWDTPQHRPDDARRMTASGRPYAPFHDVQMAVDGAAAAALGQLARERWLRVTGEPIPLAPPGLDPWPAEMAVDFAGVDVAIARTQPAHGNRPAVREVEALYLDAIAAARRWIYIENQYVTSVAIGEALAARLEERDGPEVVIVQPRHCEGWLENSTMGPLRGRLAQRLYAADRYGRLQLYYPHVSGLAAGMRLTVHAKVLVVDDRLLRIGSANLNNRSMGLDSECDVAIESRGDPTLAARIAAVRDQLVGEHVGRQPAAVAERLRATGSLIRTIEQLTGAPRGLRRLEVDPEPWVSQLVLDGAVVDPSRAIVDEPIVIPPNYRLRRGRHRMWPMVAALVAAGALGYRAMRSARA